MTDFRERRRFPACRARIAHALPRRKLEIAFGLFLWLISVRFLVSLL